MATRDRGVTDTASGGGLTGSAETPTGPGSGGSASAAGDVRPGDCLGRYTIRGLIGAGGMGRVFAAYDPELGRTIAVKIVRGERLKSERARARLRREAQALARLHHANVVTVHDVGTEGEQVFVAMELVEGRTLSDWLLAEERSWRDILTTFRAAGRGLAAAHTVGIVHRDFKPENVIVGTDRVVVVDFGLARAGDDEPPSAESGPVEEDEVVKLDLTLTGERVGTPSYMAPEQAAGESITAKADQYAFCVALKEALEGHPARSSRRADVPGWVMTAVARGLSRDPDGRWPSMEALLDALAHDPTARWRRRLLIAGAAALVGAAFLTLARNPVPDPCAGGAARLAGVWDPARKDAVRAAFSAVHLPYGDDTWTRVSARLDAYTTQWLDVHRETCRATRVEGRQSDTLMDLRMGCLEQKRSVLAGLTGLWAHGMDGESLAAATQAARGLPPLDECGDVRALTERAPLPADPIQRSLIAATRLHLDFVKALILAHHWKEARPAATAVRAEAEATGWAEVRADAAFAEGHVLSDLQDPRTEAVLIEAARLAGLAHDDQIAARALVELVRILAVSEQTAGRGVLVADIAEGVAARAGDPKITAMLLGDRGEALLVDGKIDAARASFVAAAELAAASGADENEQNLGLSRLAKIAEAQGNYAEALRLGEQSLSKSIALVGAEHPTVATVLNNLAMAAAGSGDYDAAAAYLRRALVLKEKIFGPDGLSTVNSIANLGEAELARGNLDEAEKLLEHALAIRTKAYGADHAKIATPLVTLAAVRRKQGRFDVALELLTRALAIRTTAFGSAHASVGEAVIAIGDVLADQGDAAGALASYSRGLAIRTEALGAAHPLTLQAMTQVARTLVRLHRPAEARPLAQGAAAGLEKALGPTHPSLAEALAAGAECDLEEGHAAAALAALERALAIDEKAKVAPVDRGAVRWPLARALASLGRQPEALAAATRAAEELAADADGATDRLAARAWLAARTSR